MSALAKPEKGLPAPQSESVRFYLGQREHQLSNDQLLSSQSAPAVAGWRKTSKSVHMCFVYQGRVFSGYVTETDNREPVQSQDKKRSLELIESEDRGRGCRSKRRNYAMMVAVGAGDVPENSTGGDTGDAGEDAGANAEEPYSSYSGRHFADNGSARLGRCEQCQLNGGSQPCSVEDCDTSHSTGIGSLGLQSLAAAAAPGSMFIKPSPLQLGDSEGTTHSLAALLTPQPHSTTSVTHSPRCDPRVSPEAQAALALMKQAHTSSPSVSSGQDDPDNLDVLELLSDMQKRAHKASSESAPMSPASSAAAELAASHASRALKSSSRCEVCQIQRKGKCGTTTAPRSCKLRMLILNGGGEVPRGPSPKRRRKPLH